MTDSACWITKNDGYGGEEKIFEFGSAPQTYWISLLTHWARANQRHIEHVNSLAIRVEVTRSDIIAYVESVYRPGVMLDWPLVPLLNDNDCYWLCADEF